MLKYINLVGFCSHPEIVLQVLTEQGGQFCYGVQVQHSGVGTAHELLSTSWPMTDSVAASTQKLPSDIKDCGSLFSRAFWFVDPLEETDLDFQVH